MKPAYRIAIAGCYAAAMALFWFGPGLLGLDVEGRLYWAAAAQLGGPLVAAVFCAMAAWRSHDGDRTAWLCFAAGASIYVLGNLCYLYWGVIGYDPVFPTWPDAAYFVMAMCFAAGIVSYGRLRARTNPVQVQNFILIYCAIALASLMLLHPAIAASQLNAQGTTLAFLYPALWFSVAVSGLLSVLIYDQGRKSFAMWLLILGFGAEAAADVRYVLALMDGTYQLGGLTQMLWVASAGLVGWAGLEQMAVASGGPVALPRRRSRSRSVAQAVVPAAAVGVVLVTAALTGALAHGPYMWVAAVLAVVFSVVAGFREHWVIQFQRQLRGDAEESRERLTQSEARLTRVLESTSESVLVLDHDWNVAYYNHRAKQTIGKPQLLRIGISVWELFPNAATSGEGDHYKRAVATGEPAEFEIFVEDRQVWLDIHAYPSQDGLSIFFRDVSDRKRAHDEIVHMAHHDALTGLGNRLMFQTRLAAAIGDGQDVTVLLIDLDHFKEVNDTLGHPVGDAVLIRTAERLRDCLPAGTTIARLGGDEFAVILVNEESRYDVGLLASRILDVASAPYLIEGQSVRVSACIGIAVGSLHEPPDEVFRDADIALYAAKSDMRGGFRFFEPAMEVSLQQRQSLRADLAMALERGEFHLVYQPLVDTRTGAVSGFEALLRWGHPQRGPIPPDVFIPVAEESGLIVPIGEWVLRTAAAEACNWADGITIAVNLSPRQFADGDLAPLVERVLAETGLPAQRLEIEITESVQLTGSNSNVETLQRLRNLGVRIALDDFGTGFSSLAYLQRFAFSKIKIDRSFVSGLPESGESRAIVRSVIGLGRALGMRVTAEGVETEGQFDWVKDDCDEAQGYYLSRPVPAAEIAGLVARLEEDVPRRAIA